MGRNWIGRFPDFDSFIAAFMQRLAELGMAQDIIPDANNTRSLGSATKAFKDLFQSGRTQQAFDIQLLGSGATTFVVSTNCVDLTGDGGGNTIATITGGYTGQLLLIYFEDGNVTITDTDAGTADTIDLAGVATNLSSAQDTTLLLFYNGTKWYEVSRSVN